MNISPEELKNVQNTPEFENKKKALEDQFSSIELISNPISDYMTQQAKVQNEIAEMRRTEGRLFLDTWMKLMVKLKVPKETIRIAVEEAGLKDLKLTPFTWEYADTNCGLRTKICLDVIKMSENPLCAIKHEMSEQIFKMWICPLPPMLSNFLQFFLSIIDRSPTLQKHCDTFPIHKLEFCGERGNPLVMGLKVRGHNKFKVAYTLNQYSISTNKEINKNG